MYSEKSTIIPLASVLLIKPAVNFWTRKPKRLYNKQHEPAFFTSHFQWLSILLVYTLVVITRAFFAQLVEIMPTVDVFGAVVAAKDEVTVKAETSMKTETVAAAEVVAAAEQIGTITVARISRTFVLVILTFVVVR